MKIPGQFSAQLNRQQAARRSAVRQGHCDSSSPAKVTPFADRVPSKRWANDGLGILAIRCDWPEVGTQVGTASGTGVGTKVGTKVGTVPAHLRTLQIPRFAPSFRGPIPAKRRLNLRTSGDYGAHQREDHGDLSGLSDTGSAAQIQDGVGTKVGTAPTVLSSSMLKGEIPMWEKVPIIKGWAETERFELSVQMYPYDGLANRWFQPLTHVSGW